MTRRLGAAAALVVLVGGGCTSSGSSASDASSSGSSGSGSGSSGSSAPPAGGWVAADDDDAVFTVDCTFSHRASDDPIVRPGDPGASHSHEFFGSAATDAASTGPSLRGTPTTCDDTDDTAAYWVPTLSVDGAPVDPTFVRAYYRAVPGADVREVVAPPLGLAMIAGDPARGASDDMEHEGDHGAGGAVGTAGWGCGLRPRQVQVEPPTDCTDPSPLTLQLRFPDCWDGEQLDSDDHRSHVADSVDGTCPATHPVLMTQLQVSVQWPVTGPGEVTLSSGPVAGAHGDFLNGWDPEALADHVDLCIKAKASCTIG